MGEVLFSWSSNKECQVYYIPDVHLRMVTLEKLFRKCFLKPII